jgi:hypothetical protein
MVGLLAAHPAAAQSVVSSVTLNPATVAGGQYSTVTVTLSAPAPAAGAVVGLTSSSPLAWVPTYLGIAPGLTTASFTVVTFETTEAVTSNISASYGGATASAVLAISPTAGSQTDAVSVASAQYDSRKRQLKVDARSTVSSATLSVYVTSTNQLIGTLRNQGGGRYQGQFSLPSNPGSITIKSSHGGTATAHVFTK